MMKKIKRKLSDYRVIFHVANACRKQMLISTISDDENITYQIRINK